MKTVLTIAGSDCSGGAGIQADIKTITAHKLYAMSTITALTAQNTTGVYGVLEADADFVGRQMDCIFTDIDPDAVKIGMVSSLPIIAKIAEKLTEYQAKHIVLDPVMIATSGSVLLNANAVDALITHLLPLAEIITPNIPEAEVLAKIKIATAADMQTAAQKIRTFYSGNILIKGGHLTDRADDLLLTKENETVWFSGARIATKNTHGTGCTLSSAIACHLSCGRSVREAVASAKAYVAGALAAGLNLGHGSGPLDHTYALRLPLES